MGAPVSISINGKNYALVKSGDAVRRVWEPDVKERRQLAGSERSAEVKRSDVLEWVQDDWSGGEGQPWIRPDLEGTFTQYLKSSGPVNIRHEGQISLGWTTAEDFSDTVAGLQDPRLAVTGNSVWLVYETDLKENSTGGGTYTTRTSGLANDASGRMAGMNSRVYYGDAASEINRATSSGVTQWVGATGSMCVVTDNRLYFAKLTANEKVELQRVPLQPSGSAPFTPETVGTIQGVDYVSDMVGSGVNVFILVADNEGRPRIYRYNGVALTEFVTLPGSFQVSSSDGEYLTVVNGLLFIGGYVTNSDTDGEEPVLAWYRLDGGQGGIIGALRERALDHRIFAVGEGIDDQVVFVTGTTNPLDQTPDLRFFAYSMRSGGVYEFAQAFTSLSGLGSVVAPSIVRHRGAHYISVSHFLIAGTDTVYVLVTSPASYPDSSKVESSKWDFGFPRVDKLALRLIVSGTFPSDSSASVSLELDDGSEITTDAAGATMTATADGDTTFTLSNASTERTFRWAKINLTLTANTANTSTPTVNSVLLEATTISRRQFIDLRIDLSDSQGRQTPAGRSVTARTMANELRDLLNSSTNYVVPVSLFHVPEPPHSREEEALVAILDGGRLDLDERGFGEALLRFRLT